MKRYWYELKFEGRPKQDDQKPKSRFSEDLEDLNSWDFEEISAKEAEA